MNKLVVIKLHGTRAFLTIELLLLQLDQHLSHIRVIDNNKYNPRFL